MTYLLANSFFSVPIEFWTGAMIALITGTSLGFLAGYFIGRDSFQRRIKQAGKEVTRLVETIIDLLDTAHSACEQLESFSEIKLTSQQQNRLESKQSTLFQSFRNIFTKVEKEKAASLKAKQKKEKKPKKKKVKEFKWNISLPENATSLPNRNAFDMNLNHLLEYCQAAEVEAGLLFIKVDKYSHLEKRFGKIVATNFLQMMQAIVGKATRKEDLLCQYNQETFALLIPSIDLASGEKIAHAIRSAIRHHRFRLEAGAPEVLVTASFGYTQCFTTDVAELVINRAANGLERSQKRGRNQIHISTQNDLIHSNVS